MSRGRNSHSRAGGRLLPYRLGRPSLNSRAMYSVASVSPRVPGPLPSTFPPIPNYLGLPRGDFRLQRDALEPVFSEFFFNAADDLAPTLLLHRKPHPKARDGDGGQCQSYVAHLRAALVPGVGVERLG